MKIRFAFIIAQCVHLNCVDAKKDDATSSSASASESTTGPLGTASGPEPTSGGGVKVCVQSCVKDADCCSEDPLCPSPMFPHNPRCSAAGSCELPQCSSDEECTFDGGVPANECHPIDGIDSCFTPCEADGDCSQFTGVTCTGIADDGVKYCSLPQTACRGDGDCLPGLGDKCDVESGICGCEHDLDCSGLSNGTCRPHD